MTPEVFIIIFASAAALVAWDYRRNNMAKSKIKLNKNKTVDLNEFAKRVTLEESGLEQVGIGQIKEIVKKAAKELIEVRKEFGQDKMIETVERLAK